MRAALYARVSTSEASDLQDPETQLVALRDYCRFRQWDIYKEYSEHASGVDDNRPELRNMLNDAAAGKFDYILVFRIDRLTRSPLKLLLVLEELQDPKTKRYLVNLVSATEGVDTSSRLSEGMLLMLGIFAKMERDGIQERVQAGMDRAKRYGTKSGKPIGRPKAKIPWEKVDRYIETHHHYTHFGDYPPSIAEISRDLGIPRSTLQRAIKERDALISAQNPDSISDRVLQEAAQKEGGTPLIYEPPKNEGAQNEVVLSRRPGGEDR